jgi:anti-anti-sigma regulatory factor
VRTVRLDDDTYVLTLEADLDLAEAERLSVAFRVLPARRFIVDLTKVVCLDPGGVERLTRAPRERPLEIVTDDPRTARIFETVDSSLTVHPMLADALAR